MINPGRLRFGKRINVICLIGALLISTALIVLAVSQFAGPPPTKAIPPPNEEEGEATAAEVHRFCGHCHKYPPPDTFPKDEWRREVVQGYQFFQNAKLPLLNPPDVEKVVNYYENRAPEQLAAVPKEVSLTDLPIRLQRSDYFLSKKAVPGISNVNLVRLTHKTKLDVLACDMRDGWVTVFKPYAPEESFPVGKVAHPAHAEVVDLDQDGIDDVIVADLGIFEPGDAKKGKVIWFKGLPDGTFKPFTLLEGVGRVADVQMADFNGDGKMDLVVAVFGWRNTGEIIYLENQTTNWDTPKFVPHVVDDRHGAIHVPVADLNGDGKPDFVALISQEHETIVAFINEGNGKFRKEIIFEGPHPVYGSSGIQLVDLNKDGKLDVLYTNGDSFDSGPKPWHSVQWLENQGKYPFLHHHLATLPGACRAVAADLDGDGLLDVVAVTLLPEYAHWPLLPKDRPDSIILLRQKAPGEFVRYSVEKANFNYPTCAVGDLDGDGKIHLVTGSLSFSELKDGPIPAISVWRNLGPAKIPRLN